MSRLQDTAATVFIFFMHLLVTGPSTRAVHRTSWNFTVPGYCLLVESSVTSASRIKKLLRETMLNRHFRQDEGPRSSAGHFKISRRPVDSSTQHSTEQTLFTGKITNDTIFSSGCFVDVGNSGWFFLAQEDKCVQLDWQQKLCICVAFI